MPYWQSGRRRSIVAPLLGLGVVALIVAGVALAAGLRGSSEREGYEPAALPGHLHIARRDSARAASVAGSSRPIIGTNDAAGWGPRAARTILRGHIGWDRVALGGPYDTLAASLRYGFKVLAVVNNVEAPLSAVNPEQWGAEAAAELKANRGVSIAEADNESYLKNGVAEPAQYGRMYLAAVQDMKAAGIHIPLLFDMTGDIPLGGWGDPSGWSEDASGGGWLRDAVEAVPGLAAAILANGLSIHPYGAVGENNHDDWGTGAVAAEEATANAVLGSIPPVYVTEIGWALQRCGATTGACSRHEQSRKLLAAYEVLLADPHVDGIWWYQSHDDSTGHYGFMNKDNGIRPAFRTLSAIAAQVAG